MKKTKILIPALSIASVGAVVAPMVTSCKGDVFMTITNPEFVGTPHEEVKAENGWDQVKATEEYFKDRKNLVEDFATMTIAAAKASVLEKEPTAKNVKVESVNIKFIDLNIGSQKNTNTSIGYLASGSMDMSIKYSYDLESAEETIDKIHHQFENNMVGQFNNCFATVKYTPITEVTDWALYIDGLTAIDLNWSMSETATSTKTTSTIYKNGNTKSVKETYTYSNSLSGKAGNDKISVFGDAGSYCPSNYLSKVAYKKA